jgi:hypothetical protein
MSLPAVFFVPGPMELLIIGAMCLGVVGLIVAVIVIALATSKKNRSDMVTNPNLYPCPDCGHWVSRQAPSCPQCGRPLTPGQQP